ncbi:MAG: hypothetical protein IKT42_07310 [Clostridia bacterium]|nr:hypothetical protein [Clostridia bacterium]
MKKIIALALSLLMILTCLAGCGEDEVAGNLDSAIAFLDNMYQTGKKDEPMLLGASKDVLTVVTVDGVSYNVEWSIEVTEGDKDAVKIVESDTKNCVKIEIPYDNTADILFTAIATIKDGEETATANYKFKVKGLEIAEDAADVESILNDAYALAEGGKMEEEVTLIGKITAIDTPYSADYKNVTVTIAIEGFEDKPIKCYRLAGDGAEGLAVGDTITVTGIIINYKGTVEFEQGCTLKAVVKADGTTTETPSGTTSTPAGTTSTPSGTTSKPSGTTSTPSGNTSSNTSGSTSLKLVTDKAKILKDAFALGRNETTPYIAQLEGKVISIDKEYNEQYGSICCTISVDNKNIKCWNMKGDDTSKLKIGDTITVRGVIKNFFYDDADTAGDVEFTYDDASQTEVVMIKRVAGKEENKALSIVDTPVAGTAYKFGFVSTSSTKGGTYYAVGGMNGYYMATTTSASVAIDVYVENTTGGFYLYTKDSSGKKLYMNMEISGTHVNAVYRDKASTVYTYNSTLKTLVTTLVKDGENKEYAFGTYNDYVTIGTTQTSKDSYFCHFYK